MNISDEAIEAAAAALWERRPMMRLEDGSPKPFSEIHTSYYRARYIGQARAALEAAAPGILADNESCCCGVCGL